MCVKYQFFNEFCQNYLKASRLWNKPSEFSENKRASGHATDWFDRSDKQIPDQRGPFVLYLIKSILSKHQTWEKIIGERSRFYLLKLLYQKQCCDTCFFLLMVPRVRIQDAWLWFLKLEKSERVFGLLFMVYDWVFSEIESKNLI